MKIIQGHRKSFKSIVVFQPDAGIYGSDLELAPPHLDIVTINKSELRQMLAGHTVREFSTARLTSKVAVIQLSSSEVLMVMAAKVGRLGCS